MNIQPSITHTQVLCQWIQRVDCNCVEAVVSKISSLVPWFTASFWWSMFYNREYIYSLEYNNLVSILKSRDINLLTKVRLVKAMVFPVVMYGCKSWTIKKAECEELMFLNCGVREDSWESPGLMWKDPDAGKDWRQEEKGMIEDEMVGWHHWLNGHGFGWTLGVGDGLGGLACCGSWGRKESDTTEWLNWTGLQGDETSQSQRKSVLNVHWKDWCWSWNSNTLATWCEELTHWKIPWCWEGLKAGGEGDNRGWDSWMASPTRWTWVWASSRS